MTERLEREVKLPFESPVEARHLVLALGALPLRPRRLQRDAVLDTDDHTLFEQRSLLRVRQEEGRAVVTFKGAPFVAAMKVREEIETAADDAEAMLGIFERLGLTVRFVYEKYREEFSFHGTIIAIDETPVGTYVEVEGPELAVAESVRALGRGPEHYVLDSYRTLYVRDCEQRGIAVANMLFPCG